MYFLYFISNWLLIWSFLYYFKIVYIPPLYEVLLLALIVALGINLKNLGDWKTFLFILIPHAIPLFIVKRNYERKTILVNILLVIIYVLFMRYNKENIIKFYKKSVNIINKKGLNYAVKYYLR